MKFILKTKIVIAILLGFFSAGKLQAMDSKGAPVLVNWKDICAMDVSAYDDPDYSEQDFCEKTAARDGHLLPLYPEIEVDIIPQRNRTDELLDHNRLVSKRLIAAALKAGITVPAHILAHFK